MDYEDYIKQLIKFKPELTTSEAVEYLNHKKYNADALRKPEVKKQLSAKRKGKRNLVFCTYKLFELKKELFR